MKKLSLVVVGVVALAGCGEPDSGPAPPVIISVNSSAATVDETVGTVDLTADVTGDELIYHWTADSGTLDDDASETPTWTADTVSTTSHTPAEVIATIQLHLSNAAGEAMDTVPVTVTNLNELPVIDTPATASAATVIPTNSFDLTVVASDPEGDGLSYLWEQVTPANPTGTFLNEATDIATWTAPIVAVDTTFTFSITITDTETGTVLDTATSDVLVPSWSLDVIPIMNGAECSNCHGNAGGAGGLEFDTVLEPDLAHTTLTTTRSDECDNAIGADAVDDLFVDPINGPTASILWYKITDPTLCNQGGMPFMNFTYWENNDPLGPVVIEAWITGGAPNN